MQAGNIRLWSKISGFFVWKRKVPGQHGFFVCGLKKGMG